VIPRQISAPARRGPLKHGSERFTLYNYNTFPRPRGRGPLKPFTHARHANRVWMISAPARAAR